MAVELTNLKHWRFHIDFENLAWAIFDQAGQSQNTLGRDTVEELEAIVSRVEEAARDKSVRGLIVMSGKEASFIAGADIREFESMASEGEVTDVIHAVTGLFDRIEKLPVPVIAAIHGYCLGGGLEFALACHYRIADREDGTRLGLPEVKLGIIPGLHGSARWLRQSGPLQAMPNMLAGRMLRPTQARAAGIVDQLVPGPLELRWAARKAALQGRKSKRAGFFATLTASGPARGFLASRMRRETAAKVREEHYPAPFRLIDLFEKDGGDYETMRRAETRAFAPLFVSEQSRNLRRVFHLTEMLKAEAPKSVGFRPERAHVVGAGTMGGDIAAVCVLSGMEVSLQDQSPEAVEAALARAKGLFKKRLRGANEVSKAVARLIADAEGRHVARADVVIEAIFENLEAKQALFREIEPKLKPGALLATNTSSLPIEQIASVLRDPSRLIGLHFFNPVPQLPLVEVVRGPEAREEDIRKCCAFVTQIGKYPLIVKSAPGFLVNRVLAPYMFGAMQSVEQGASKEKIDAAAEKFGMPMGPIELADVVGLDVAASVARVLKLPFPEDSALARLVQARKLGKKSGEGFYKWADGKPQKPAQEFDKAELSALGRDLIKPLVDECERCLADGIVESADHVDAGVIFGTGFAPFRGGPLHYRRTQEGREREEPASPPEAANPEPEAPQAAAE
jgi:3-hydroxyacyl-CoA dehydrogenase/enoyl-CoA hydratase/3-hydroxybutyryl-CoA epimerase